MKSKLWIIPLVVVALSGCPKPGPIPTPNPNPIPPPPAGSVVIAQQLLDEHNKLRGANHELPLKLNMKLVTIAQQHANDMAIHKFMSHTGSDGSSPYQRMDAVGYKWSAAGENVAMGYPTIPAVMSGWMGSPGHRANILHSGFVEYGGAVGIDKDGAEYWVSDFGTPANSINAAPQHDTFPPPLEAKP
jgi:uncharacterized protein YkwD